MNLQINHNKREDGYSEIVLRYVMDYNLWKQTYSEYLERYEKELEEKDDKNRN